VTAGRVGRALLARDRSQASAALRAIRALILLRQVQVSMASAGNSLSHLGPSDQIVYRSAGLLLSWEDSRSQTGSRRIFSVLRKISATSFGGWRPEHQQNSESGQDRRNGRGAVLNGNGAMRMQATTGDWPPNDRARPLNLRTGLSTGRIRYFMKRKTRRQSFCPFASAEHAVSLRGRD